VGSLVTEDSELEALALAQNKRFWKLIDDAIERSKKEGFVDWCGAAKAAPYLAQAPQTLERRSPLTGHR
jgi:hypothetical protein